MSGLEKAQIDRLLLQLNEKLMRDEIRGEIFLVGGAVMCLVFNARASTRDIDAFFKPASRIRAAALEIADEENLGRHWLNDAVKGFLSEHGRFDNYIELSHLKVFSAQPEYLFAMKCMAMRIGEEFHDLDDVRYLIRYLGLTTYGQALDVIGKYYPRERVPQKTLYALEELVDEVNN